MSSLTGGKKGDIDCYRADLRYSIATDKFVRVTFF